MKITLYTFVLSLFMFNCAKNEPMARAELSADNPFNVSLNEPYDYANVTGDDIEEYVNVNIKNAKQDIEDIKNLKDINFENTFVVFDKIQNSLSKAYSNAHMFFWVSTDSVARAKGLEGFQKISPLFTDVYSDKLLFNQFKKFVESENYNQLSSHRKLLVDDIMENFELSGVNLDEESLKKFKKLNEEINELTSQYSTNMNTANLLLALDEAGAEGLPENFKAQYKTEDGTYEIPVQPASSGPVLNNAKLEDTRKKYATLYANRAKDSNLIILDSLVSRRYQIGKIMGFDSYAAYNLKPKMAKDPVTVWNFINDLISKSKEKAIADVEVLKSQRNKIIGKQSNADLNPWDIGYYNNEILKNEYNVDHERIREYLPMESCLTGMFDLYQELLGLEFKKVENPSVWHEDVEMYEVFDGNKLKGQFYLDLFPRPYKESWFYGVPLTSGRMTTEGYEVPVCMLLGNFTKPTEELPSLLSHSELNTLFHEFGHVMDKMAYEGEFSSQSNSKTDFTEAMSQIFENWILDYEVLSSFGKHFETGEVFPKELFDNMIKAKTVSSGLSSQRQLRNCLYDMNLYDRYNPDNPIDTDQLWKDIDQNMGVLNRHIEGTHPQASWIHINTHPVYMYGYLWSEVYAQDMFTVFEKNGLRDKETGVRYRKLILANGSQRDIVEAVKEFLGRPSNNEAYIKSLGLE
ncbi:M3 family metallopeptidase [Yeosuana sp. MJ-SS3]|uniref:M3 family metallopeptidase n=1 Tax=Gilvirhabdus luticola TaxID=3079858 RepID=A0ABU3U8I8_9FLAO|nr:M3 family metallopeptidase [Yeosuana sp. MJ-SS3]MDU8886395.1 M3 family metallopeptidase [Yeosuana sp. MJ-SS3]